MEYIALLEVDNAIPFMRVTLIALLEVDNAMAFLIITNIVPS